MALVPYCDDICHDLELFPSKFFDDDFWEHHAHHHFPLLWWHPSWCCANYLRTKVIVNDKGFQIKMHLPLFKRNEITVKTQDDIIVIEGKRKERSSNERYCCSQEFMRKFKLPKGYNAIGVTSTFSADGELIVKAPAPIYPPKIKERIVEVRPAY